MECTSFKLLKCLEKDGHKGRNILGCILGSSNHLAMVRMGISNTDRFVEEEDVGVVVPGVGVWSSVVHALGLVVDGAGT